MDRFENQKILRNQVRSGQWLVVDDDFLELSLERKILSREMLNDILGNVMGTDLPSLDHCMKLCRRDPQALTQFIDILIETKRILWFCS
jgi:hypothetical protein